MCGCGRHCWAAPRTDHRPGPVYPPWRHHLATAAAPGANCWPPCYPAYNDCPGPADPGPPKLPDQPKHPLGLVEAPPTRRDSRAVAVPYTLKQPLVKIMYSPRADHRSLLANLGRSRPVRGGTLGAGRAQTSRRVHLLDLLSGPPPPPLRRTTQRRTDLPRLRLVVPAAAAGYPLPLRRRCGPQASPCSS